MIAVLEDRKGFKKRVDLNRHTSYYNIVQCESWLSINNGDVLNMMPVKGTEITFDYVGMKYDYEVGQFVSLFRERI